MPGLKLSIFTVQDHHPGCGRSLPELYDQVIRQAELADQLGFEAFFSAEHHFHEYGAVPDPAVLLAAIAARTQRIRLGPAIAALAFRDPIQVAESYAMLDVLSGGRLVLGVGSGYLAHEFAGFGVDPAEKRARFDEALAILEQALTGKPVICRGKFRTLDNIAINVAPLQPRVPLYVAVLRAEAAYHVGRAGHDIMCVPYASVDRFADVGPMAASFRRGASEAGRADADGVWAFHTHVADSDQAARTEAAAAFDLYVATRLYAKRQTYDDIIASGLGLFGSVETVADKLVRLHAMGIRHVMALMNFGLMPHERVCRAMSMLMREALPRARARIAAASVPA